MLKAREIEKILSYDFKWSVLSGKIYSLDESGSQLSYNNLEGYVYFNDNNQLEFYVEKHCSSSKFSLMVNQLERLFFRRESGEIYRKIDHHQLEFTDHLNRKWLTSCFILNRWSTESANKIVFNIIIDSLYLLDIKRKNNCFYAYTNNKLHINLNIFTKKAFSSGLNEYDFKLSEDNIHITKHDQVYIYSLQSDTQPKEVLYKKYKLVREALNIISFSPIYYVIEDTYDSDSKEIRTQIYSYKKIDLLQGEKFFPSDRLENNNAEQFISSYVNFFIKDNFKFSNSIYIWWYRLYGYELDLENKLLILSVAIESLCLNYLKVGNSEPIHSYDDIKILGRLVKSSDVANKLKVQVNKYIGNLNSSNKPVITILNQLVSYGVLSEYMSSRWKDVRNESAHGTDRDLSIEDEMSMQSVLNDLRLLEEVFFRLFFYIIGYKGQFYQFSLQGYPISRLEVTNCKNEF